MDYINAIIFGLVQGITEFLPISSSGHLVLLHEWINLTVVSDLAFDVALHLATLVAVIIYFRQDILKLALAAVKSFQGERTKDSKLAWLLLIGTIPAALVGWLFGDVIENYFRSPLTIAIMLIIGGVLLLAAERLGSRRKGLSAITWPGAIFIGLAQALALIPGTSRSGITIIAALFLGLKREAAVRFSFYLAIPIIFGAGIKKIPLLLNPLAINEIIVLLLAMLVALIAGMWAIKLLLVVARKASFVSFAVYRFGLAAIILFYLFLF